jgi:hypothetical protein
MHNNHTVKLTPRQKAVMQWLDGGWVLYRGHGKTVTVNGTKICNMNTVLKLIKLNLVKELIPGEWSKNV